MPVLPMKTNYMLLSLQRIFVLSVIFAGVFVVVHYTPMPGTDIFCNLNWCTAPVALWLVTNIDWSSNNTIQL